MKNKNNLPRPIVNAIVRKERDYTPSKDRDAYNTELPTPPRVRWLKERHREEIKENQDASDFLLMLMGTAFHKVLEEGAKGEPDLIAEGRLILDTGKYRVSTTLDLYDRATKILYDYKVTTVWKLKDEPPAEWVSELNVSAEALRQSGETVAGAKLVYFLRDHTPKWARDNKDIDQGRIALVDVPLLGSEDVISWVNARCEIKELALAAESQDQLPDCTPEECWEQPTKWAVMKKGRVSAIRLFNEEENANSFMVATRREKPGSYYLDRRPGKRTKCEQYCDVSEWCDQYKKFKEENK